MPLVPVRALLPEVPVTLLAGGVVPTVTVTVASSVSEPSYTV